MTRTAAIALLLAASGCATPRATLRELPEADITTAEQVRPHLHHPDSFVWLALAVSEPESDDPNCPARLEFGNTVTWVGGCTDESGNAWSGSLRVRTGSERMSVRMHQFQSRTMEGPAHGHVRLPEGGVSIALRWVDEDGQNVIIFRARSEEDEKGPTVWSGKGHFGSEEHGKVEFETYEVHDRSVCKTEPLSGTTQLHADGHTVEVIYDGATDCDPEGRATWTLDGVPMGELQIPKCSATSDNRAWPGVFVLMIVAVARRRTRRVPGQ